MIRRLRPLLLAITFAALTLSATAIDQVIFKDGFSITGRRFQESETIRDPGTGTAVIVPKRHGFDMMESGAKIIIFSNKTQQVSKVMDNVKTESKLDEYMRDVFIKSANPLPGGIIKLSEFDKNWKRTLRVELPATKGFALIDQQIKVIGPTRVVIPSTNYAWAPYYNPHEFDPAMLRKLLAYHPNLAEKPDEPDIGKRLDIARYFQQADWLDAALKEIRDTQETVKTGWTKELSERAESMTAEIHKARMLKLTNDLEQAVKAGQYTIARERAGKFDEKAADAATMKQFTTLKAQIEDVEPRFLKAKSLLRATIDRFNGTRPVDGALSGGMALALKPRSPLSDAAEAVFNELHPDTTNRIDFFLSINDPNATTENLLALAITGWLKGKNGAEQNVDTAIKLWHWREMLLAYQNEPVLNKRRTMYMSASTGGALSADEIAQLISYLPPPLPDNLSNPGGTAIAPGIYVRNTGPITETAKGIEYLVRLPREYHHGRPARTILAMTNNNIPISDMINLLAPEADRHGCIIIAPVWVNNYEGAYDFKGEKHYIARAALRDALKHFRIDNDRVFLFGLGEGANFALDLGASHPDLFAGIVTVGASPRYDSYAKGARVGAYNVMMHYWRNCQKLPVYSLFGTLDGDAFIAFRKVYENWMERGYPAMGVILRGRSFGEVGDWLRPELPTIFDWMEPKKRVTGTAMLRVNEIIEPWVIVRETDSRFYWVGSDKIDRGCQIDYRKGESLIPAEIVADIRTGNQIVLKTRGTNNVVIWFDRTLIDWSKPVSVSINGSAPTGYKPKVLQQDIEFMLEQLYQHGDRSLLFLNKLEFPTVR